jgi:hypothetical protein
MIEALATNRSDQAFSMAVLPRRPGCGRTVADSHRMDATFVGRTECPVTVVDQVAWRRVQWEGLCHLSGDPFGGRIGSDAERYQSATLMIQDHQTAEQFEKRSRYHEEIDRSAACGMITQEGVSGASSAIAREAGHQVLARIRAIHQIRANFSVLLPSHPRVLSGPRIAVANMRDETGADRADDGRFGTWAWRWPRS